MAMSTQPLLAFLEAQETYEQARATVGPTIRALRLDAGLTQSGAATMAGISQSYLSQIENGDRTPEVATMNSLLSVLEGSTSGNDLTEEAAVTQEG